MWRCRDDEMTFPALVALLPFLLQPHSANDEPLLPPLGLRVPTASVLSGCGAAVAHQTSRCCLDFRASRSFSKHRRRILG